MKSLRDAELAIRKLDDFKIEKFKIAVRIAKNDKVKAALMLQKKVRMLYFFLTLDNLMMSEQQSEKSIRQVG